MRTYKCPRCGQDVRNLDDIFEDLQEIKDEGPFEDIGSDYSFLKETLETTSSLNKLSSSRPKLFKDVQKILGIITELETKAGEYEEPVIDVREGEDEDEAYEEERDILSGEVITLHENLNSSLLELIKSLQIITHPYSDRFGI